LMKFGKVIQEVIKTHAENPAMKEFTDPLAALLAEVTKLTAEIGQKAMKNPDEVGAAAVPYLRVIGHLVFSFAWVYAAGVALKKVDSGDAFYKSKLATARFYFAKLYPESAAMIKQVRSGSAPMMEMDAALF
ncbi:MAG: acyl-CoA dehydrogenase C-terminal domain-containing protein, partial [Stenotrophobium sp.]